jgi:rfaE bifunctional protein nucleotidyltransferase chain/domain
MGQIYTLKELKILIDQEPEKWRPLVLTNGCFDLLHVGHVRYLNGAKNCGKTLIVGLNSDRSVQTIKPSKAGSPPRPLNPQDQRAEILINLKSVDGVVIFSEATASELIKTLQPDIYVKGGDYTLETLPETPFVKAYGGEIKLIEVQIPTSTTKIIQKILGLVNE